MKVVYKLFCKDSNIEKIYIGSSKNFKHRLKSHKSKCKSSNYNVYKYIREHGGWSNWTYLFIEEYEDIFDNQLLKERESYHIDLTWDMNLNVERPYGVGDGEKEREKIYKRKYHEKNRVKRLEKAKIYRQQNKIKISEKRKIKIDCGFCGLNLRKDCMKIHQKTKKCKLIQGNL
tara:strand:- start:95 stop:616 length:522 start_codon:yes stop_codon:yes gene_type:complete